MKKISQIKKIINICKKENIEITGSLFQTSSQDLNEIINICKKYNTTFSIEMLFRKSNEVEDIILICNELNIDICDGMFKRNAEDLKMIINVCKENKIPITGSTFRNDYDKFISIINTCKELDLKPTGSIFKRTSKEIKEIYNINLELLGEKPKPNTFNKKPEEVKKIIQLCKKYDISITGTVYRKKANELEDTIRFIVDNYGKEYLLPQIIIETKEHVEEIFNYLLGKNILYVIINSQSIMRLTLDEISERENYIKQINEELVVNNKFNSVIGWSKKQFQEKKKELENKISK